MTKNVSVIDENGIAQGSTYPKRAAGLVKKGRARWIDDRTICLCAPKKEERQMNLYEVFDNQISKMQEQLREADEKEAMPVRIQILKTMETFKAQEAGSKLLDMITQQLTSMQEALNAEPPTPENSAAREVTRQKILDLLAGLRDNPKTTE
ncbi:MAG: hypothetical protein IJG16_02675 [Clostridia bacterium]|nr:hypothetical protein [Clostridia bacterium]